MNRLLCPTRWWLVFTLTLMSQCIMWGQPEIESLYWRQDSLLDLRIDSLGKDHVVREIQLAIRHAKKYCAQHTSSLPADSISIWQEWMRWAVILKDQKSFQLVEDLMALIKSGQRGNWQYYFTYMTMWALYEGRFSELPLSKQTDYLLSRLHQGTLIENTFYEDRLVSLGKNGLSHVLDWAKANLGPRMTELDREMLSEEDLKFPRLYNRFIAVLAAMIEYEKESQWVNDLGAQGDLFELRLRNDLSELLVLDK